MLLSTNESFKHLLLYVLLYFVRFTRILMKVTLKWMAIWYVFSICFSQTDTKRTKRIIGGFGPLYSHDVYNTHFMVSLMETWRCVTEQTNHVLKDCDHTHMCTGNLIRPDFVLTACHCMIYEDYYTGIYKSWIPAIIPRHQTVNDFPTYLVDRVNYGTLNRFQAYRKKVNVKHAVLNAMTIMAGNVRKFGKQRRHAAKFFPHHLCGARHARLNPAGFEKDTWNGEQFVTISADTDLDIGLIKTCHPFKINNDVKLAPIQPYEKIEEHLRRLLKLNMVCLIAGWGEILQSKLTNLNWGHRDILTRAPKLVHHDFRFIDCNDECALPWQTCRICNRSHGPHLSTSGGGDSGGPLVCEGFLTGVLSTDAELSIHNDTSITHVAVACVKEFITDKYLAYLRLTSDREYHYINGKPVRVIPENYPEDLDPIIFPDDA